jgi:hypothetical protein
MDYDRCRPRGLRPKRPWSAAPPPAILTGSNREASMRYKPDGTLDEVWQARRVPVMPRLTAEDVERMREEVIVQHLRHYPTMTRKEVEDEMEAFGF